MDSIIKTKNCFICHKPLSKNKQIAVFSFPLTCQSEDGKYSLFGDFFKKEKIAHIECCDFLDGFLRIDDSEVVLEKNRCKINEAKEILKQMGTKVDIGFEAEIQTLLAAEDTSVEEIIKRWFQRA